MRQLLKEVAIVSTQQSVKIISIWGESFQEVHCIGWEKGRVFFFPLLVVSLLDIFLHFFQEA